MPYDTLLRDEAKIVPVFEVVTRCPDCNHIIAYRSSGLPPVTEKEINEYIKKAKTA